MWSAYIKGNRFVLRHLTKICGHLVLSNQLLNQNIYIYIFVSYRNLFVQSVSMQQKKKEKRIKKLQTWKQINCMPKNLYKKNVQVKGQMWDFASVFGSCDFLLVCVCVYVWVVSGSGAHIAPPTKTQFWTWHIVMRIHFKYGVDHKLKCWYLLPFVCDSGLWG